MTAVEAFEVEQHVLSMTDEIAAREFTSALKAAFESGATKKDLLLVVLLMLRLEKTP